MAGHRLALTAADARQRADVQAPGEPEAAADLRPLAPVGLYVHVPFCVSLCPYCDFVVYPGAAARGPANRIAAFVDALVVELGLRADELDLRFGPPGAPGRPELASVYLGGGTPSLLPPADVDRILRVVRRRFGLARGAEVTLEVNPGPDERGDATAWASIGVTRLSIGAQALDAAALRGLGRRHAPEDVAATVADARAAGIASVGLDLLYDLPGGSLGAWEATLEAALALEPDHLSLYALTLDDPGAEGLAGPGGDHLPPTAGALRWRARARQRQDDDRAALEYEHAVRRLDDTGWRGYEISNWARPGHESRHNRAYWECRPVEAVGPGAHAFDGSVRRWNAARLDGWLAALHAPVPRLPPGGAQRLDPAGAAAERIVLALRTDRGVPLSSGDEPPLAASLPWARDAGLVRITGDDRIVLTTRGRLLSNELFSRLV